MVGERIRELRLNYGYRQSDLGNLIGCSAQVISNIERGACGISADKVLKIANEFHVPVEDILQDSDCRNACLSQEEYSLVENYRKMLPDERKMLLEMFDLFVANKEK